MKELISILLACMLLFAAAYAETNAAAYQAVALETGSVQVYDFGENRLHAYVSGDALGDVCYAVESPEGWCCWKAPRLPLATTPGKPI